MFLSVFAVCMMCSCNNSSSSEKSDASKVSTEEASKTSDEEIVKAELEKMLADVANKKMDKFQWFTKDFILETFGEEWISKEDDGNMLKAAVYSPDEWNKEINRFLGVVNSECTEKGFDWSNYNIESIKIEDKKEESFNDVKGTIYRGSFKVKSADKVYDFNFKNLAVINGAARFVDGFGLASEDE